MKCLFCETQNIEFTCQKCQNSFCINHMSTTEQWECKKHVILYSKAKAAENGYKCSVVENSSCPECKSVLKMEKLSSGQYFFECTNLNCAWNSYLKTPGLFFPSKEQLAREGSRFGLIKGLKLCGKKLKGIAGKEICPNCFLDLLKRSTITTFSTIMNSFYISAEQMLKLIENYIAEERIYGIIDQRSQMFYYISPDVREKILSKFYEEGIIKVAELGLMLDMSSDIAINVIYKLISQFQIKGSFSQDKKTYYTQKYISATLIKEINSSGRYSLKSLSNKFSLPEDLVKSFCVNLMRTKAVNAFFANRGKELITSAQIFKEIREFSTKNGLFELEKLAQNLEIAVELARKCLHDLIKKGEIHGIFTQRREFMTNTYFQTKIKELAKAYRTMPLRELSNRLGVTESSVEEFLAVLIGRGEIDGYIDMAKKLFVAYSVGQGRQGTARTAQEIPQPEGEDKIEVVREYDFVGGQLHYKVVVRNNSTMTINNIKIVLDVPTSYNVKEPMITVPVIESGNSRGVDFYLEPKECGISNIGGTVIYKNAQGTSRTINVRKKEVQIKCPLLITCLDTIEDCQLAIQTLGNDARAFLIADLDPRLAFRSGIRTLKNFDTSMVATHEGTDPDKLYEAEAWFSSEAKVTGGRVITRVYVSEASQSMEIRVWCANPGQLTGFLAKVLEMLFEQINIIRKIKADERDNTLNAMAITQNLAEISDYCMLKWKAQNIRNKLHDTFIRLTKVIGEGDPILGRMEFWLTDLNKYGKDDKISDEDADKLVNDVESFKNTLARSLKMT